MMKVLIITLISLFSSLSCLQISSNSTLDSVYLLINNFLNDTTNKVTNSFSKPSTNLENYAKINFAYVHSIEGFYIVATDEELCNKECKPIPQNTTSKDIFDHSVKLFSSFLDQNQDGKRDLGKQKLIESLARNMFFLIGNLSSVKKHSSLIQTNFKRYTISMQTDKWPYVKNWPVGNFTNTKITLSEGKYKDFPNLTSSTWRPEAKNAADGGFNALWEETFHTITTAYNRSENTFSFAKNSFLQKAMDADRTNNKYDTSRQNSAENGKYDDITAVNEYIHQIWLYQLTGNESKLSKNQKKILNHINETLSPLDFPKYATNSPISILGRTVKGSAVR